MRHHSVNNKLLDVLTAHGLADENVFKEYLDRREVNGIWRLYVRLWAEVVVGGRHHPVPIKEGQGSSHLLRATQKVTDDPGAPMSITMVARNFGPNPNMNPGLAGDFAWHGHGPFGIHTHCRARRTRP
jgi:hypothetical protein